MARGRPINVNGCRDISPCNGCTERFTACSDRCPKDERGDYGVKAWKRYVDDIKAKRKSYKEAKRRRFKNG